MFSYIKGILDSKTNDYLVVEANGVGYRINTSLSTVGAVGDMGDEVKIYTYLHVREDIMSLYGFVTQEELNMFKLLISVTGVGPKAAISLISTIPSTKFCLAVVTDDIKTLTRAQGIGNKTAQRIILELKDKIKKEQLTAQKEDNSAAIGGDLGGSSISEAVNALMVLGYSSAEASRAVASVYSEEMELENIIKSALKGLIK